MNKNFSSFIAELRKGQGLTQKELADRIGVSDKAVSRWENGKNYPDIEIMQSLGEIFNVSVSELLQGERLEKEEVISVSEQNVVKTVKKNKLLKITMIAVIAALIVSVTLGAVAVKSVRNPLIENTIYLPSKDIRSQLDNIQSFITDSYIDDDFTVTWLKVFFNSEKEVRDLYVEGVTSGNVYYHCGCLDDTDTFIYQHKEKRDWTPGFYCNTLIEFLDALDFSKIDKNYSIANEYHIDFHDYEYWDEYEFVINNDALYFMYDLKTKEFEPIKDGNIITGDYISVKIWSMYEGSGTLLAQILVEAQ
ncbi:MAG: helix-turn-helix domain-containing protein [Eubacterium sp.]|nr:helix-turn-helix domain-containing protein [Eubacterium sp.]